MHFHQVLIRHLLIAQVVRTIAHRCPDEPRLVGAEFVAEIETAVGAAMHETYCQLFDEVSGMNLMNANE